MNNQKTLYRKGKLATFVYSEGNPYPLDLDHPTSESATYDKSLLEQKFNDLFFEKKSGNEQLLNFILIGGAIILGVIILMFVLNSGGS